MTSTFKSLFTSFRYSAETIVLCTLLSLNAHAEPATYPIKQQTVFDLKSVFASVQSMMSPRAELASAAPWLNSWSTRVTWWRPDSDSPWYETPNKS